MSLQKNREETYKRIKKRLREYTYKSGFLTMGTTLFGALFIFSLIPVVPAIVISYLRLSFSDWALVSWFLFAAVFGALFWLFQRLGGNNEVKLAMTLEEKMYVPAYEALCAAEEFLDPHHSVLSSKTKATARLQRIDALMLSTGLPFSISIMGDAVSQMRQLRRNLKHRLRPAIRNMRQGDQVVSPILGELVDYLSKPTMPMLVALNSKIAPLPEYTERGLYEVFASSILRRSNLRHTGVFSIFGIFSLFVYFMDINYFGATKDTAFGLGLMFFLGIAAIYVTYLSLTVRREQGT